MNLSEEYKRVFAALLTNEDAYSHGWITIQRMVFSKEDLYSKTGVLDSKYERMFIPTVCKNWLYARLFGPVSNVWIESFFCRYSKTSNIKLAGGLKVFSLMVATWERNLQKVICDGKDKESFNLFAMLHYKKDTTSIWSNLSKNSKIPLISYSAVTPNDGLFKNGEYEWVTLAGPSILRMFTTDGGVGYHHKEGLLYNHDTQYELVVKSMEGFDKEAAKVMMFFQSKNMDANSITVVHAARECRIYEAAFLRV